MKGKCMQEAESAEHEEDGALNRLFVVASDVLLLSFPKREKFRLGDPLIVVEVENV